MNGICTSTKQVLQTNTDRMTMILLVHALYIRTYFVPNYCIACGASQWECTIHSESTRMEAAGTEAMQTGGVYESVCEVCGRRASILGRESDDSVCGLGSGQWLFQYWPVFMSTRHKCCHALCSQARRSVHSRLLHGAIILLRWCFKSRFISGLCPPFCWGSKEA